MFRGFLLLFVTVPLIELYVLIKVGAGIGGVNTIVLCLLTAAIGGILIRWQGLRTLLDAQHQLSRGEIPADHALHGLMLVISGILLFTPGFITDSVGFLLLVPAFRRWIIHRFFPGPPTRGPGEDIIDIEILDDRHHLP
ncbi:MAG: FxsA family protein [Zetaproteobacteria bacterium]|nr:MAG: FxsA family protein [Zetaproteobacteria bacterium]